MKSFKILLGINRAKSLIMHHLSILAHERDDFQFGGGIESSPGITYQYISLESNSGQYYSELGKIKLLEIGATKTNLTVFDPEWKKFPTPILYYQTINKSGQKNLLESGKLDKGMDRFELYLQSLILKRDEIITILEKALRKEGVLEKKVGNEKSQEHYDFISRERIKQLKRIHSPKYDLKKLILYCEELNLDFESECYLSSAILLRAICDHIPKIFGLNTFIEVANNYSNTNKSFQKSMQNLNNSLRNIADRHLHTPIRSKESLPTKSQVLSFQGDTDVLLEEIVRIL